MLFKLKKQEKPTVKGQYLGLQFRSGRTIYTITGYNDDTEKYYRDDGEGTAQTTFNYTDKEITNNLKMQQWRFVGYINKN
jgi:hypothetical protein